MVVQPHLDCVAQGIVGVVVGVLLGGEEVIVVALGGEGGVVAKAGLVCLGLVQPGAACPGLTVVAASAMMAASEQPSVVTRSCLLLSTLVQSLLDLIRLFPCREKVTVQDGNSGLAALGTFLYQR